jgi:hypothetical protein
MRTIDNFKGDATAPTGEGPRPLRAIVLAAGCMLAIASVVSCGSEPITLAPGIAAGNRACIERCARDCSPELSGDDDRLACIVQLGQCLSGCEALPKPRAGEMQLLYAADRTPQWTAVEASVARVAAQLKSCQLGVREFTAWVEVEDKGLVRPRVAIRSDTQMCVEMLLRRLPIRLADAPYQLVLRGTTPELESPPPPAPVVPSSADFLAQLNQLNPEGSAAAIGAAEQDEKAKDDYVARLRRQEAFVVRPPRVMPVEQLSNELLQSRGLMTVIVFYALAGCDPCKESLDALGPTLRAVRDVMRVHVYDIDVESMQERWVSFAEQHKEVFEPVRIDGAIGGTFKRELAKLGIEAQNKVPTFVVLEPDGRVAYSATGRSHEAKLIELLTKRSAELRADVAKRTKNQ